MALQEKYPQWSLHAAGRVAEYTEKANIQIMVDRYKSLLADTIIPAAKHNAAMAAGEAAGLGGAPGAAPSGAAPSGAAPSGAPTSGAAPAPKPGAHP